MKKIVILVAVLCLSLTACTAATNPIIPPASTATLDNGNTRLPNPRISYDSVEDAQAALYPFKIPSEMPDGYTLDTIAVIGGSVAELAYTDSSDTITYRTAKGTEDISGDYNEYPCVDDTWSINDIPVVIKGNSPEEVLLCTWTNEDETFALSFSKPVLMGDIGDIMKGLR